jgi:excisionase family DNA binding protein
VRQRMTPDLRNDEMLTVAQAASLLKVAVPTMRRWMREGRVPAYKLGPRRWVTYRSELEAMLAAAATGEASEASAGQLPRVAVERAARETVGEPLTSWRRVSSSGLMGDGR